jgi:uncharacterized protein YhbP (UPF0306 family)
VFTQIVVPMTKALRQTMVQFCFASEAEMFTSDLHYKMFDASDLNMYKGRDGPVKHEDACENLRTQLSHIIARYDKVFESLEGDKQTLSVALYLATYFDQNRFCKNYYTQNRSCVHLKDFINNHFGKLVYSAKY